MTRAGPAELARDRLVEYDGTASEYLEYAVDDPERRTISNTYRNDLLIQSYAEAVSNTGLVLK